jgi:hypothetical protein
VQAGEALQRFFGIEIEGIDAWFKSEPLRRLA